MKKVLLILLILFTFTLVSCGENNNDDNTPSETEFDVNTLVFSNKTVLYNGNVQSLVVENLPEGWEVYYEGNDKVDVGSYQVLASVYDNEGNFVTLLMANLTITMDETIIDSLENAKLTSINVTYTGDIFSIYVENLPSGYTVNYEGNGVSAVGVHNVVAKIMDANGTVVKELTATITINDGFDVELPLV